jgi:hypothetical protein
MRDTIIVTEEESKPKPAEVIVVTPEAPPQREKAVIQKTTVTETRVVE